MMAMIEQDADIGQRTLEGLRLALELALHGGRNIGLIPRLGDGGHRI